MSASRYEDIVEAIRSRLAGIVAGAVIVTGGTDVYNFTPAAVKRAQALKREYLDASVSGPLYFMVPDGLDKHMIACPNVFEANVSLDLVLCQQFTPATENPLKSEPPIRETLQSQMARDVEACLTSDPGCPWLSQYEVYNVVTSHDDRNSEQTFVAGWAVAFINLTFSYRYRGGTP